MARKIPLRLYYFAVFAALGVYLPFFPPWLLGRGIDGLSLGVVTAMFPAMSVIGPPAFGFVADALGLRGHLLRVACAGSCLGFVLIAVLASRDAAPSYGALLFSVIVFASFRSPTVMLADVVALEASRVTGDPYGKTRLFGSLGFLVGSGLVGRLIDPKSALPVPLAVAGLLFVTFLVSLLLPKRVSVPAPTSVAQVRAFVAAGDVRLFLVGALLSQCAFACFDQCFSLHLFARGAPSAVVGAAWATGVAAEVALMFASGSIAKRAKPVSMLALAYGCAAVRWVLVAIVPGWVPLFFVQLLHGPAFGLMWVSSLAYLQERAPAHLRATAQGIFTATTSVGSVLGMLVWIQIYRLKGGDVAFRGAALVSSAACVCAIVLSRLPSDVREGRKIALR